MNVLKSLSAHWRQSAAVLLLFAAGAAVADPPGRVARLAYVGGEVSFAPAGEDAWFDARLNRPLVVGDRLWTGRGGRAELQLGSAVMRLDRNTSFEFLNLDDQLAQIQLTEGTLNLRVDALYDGQIYEVNTPTLAFVVNEPGEYRLDVTAMSNSTQVTLFDGSAEVYGEQGRSQRLFAGSSTRFYDPGLHDVERLAMPQPDDFDHWAFARNDRYLQSPSRQYVSNELIGYDDLDDYGSWRHVSDYGHVWFPRRVSAGWAPYRDGHWSWIEPWGWTWVDDAPWGFAPFHYGRWVYVSNGWGWLPGPRHVRPVYAPALVAFVGGSNWSLTVSSGGPPIGWFPLGPRDVYVPWYRSSRDYFGRVNVHNTVIINNTYVTNVYNDYYVQGRPLRRDFTFRGAANAVTVMPRDGFTSAQNAAESMARNRLRPGQLGDAELLTRAPAAPTRASLTGPGTGMNPAPPTRSFDRGVIARTAPAEQVAPFDARQRAIVRNGGEPLAADQMRRINSESSFARTRNVEVIGQPRTDTGRTASIGMRDRQPAGDRDTTGTAPRGTPIDMNSRMRAPTATSSAPERSSRALPSAGYSRERIGRAGNGEQAGIPLPESRAPLARDRSGSAAPIRRDTTSAVERNTAPSARESTPAPVRGYTPSSRDIQQRSPSTGREAIRSNEPVQRVERVPSTRSSLPGREVAAPRASSPAPRQAEPAPSGRSFEPRSAPQPRAMPEPRRAPEPRAMPESRRAPEPRAIPESRSAPEQRSAPAPREAPVQRSAPARGQDDGGARSAARDMSRRER